MEVSAQVLKRAIVVIGACLLVAVVFSAIRESRHNKQVRDLQNQLATSAKTIEVQEGVFKKLTLESQGLKSLLDSKDAQVIALEQQIKKNHEEILSATSATVSWKKAYEGIATGHQTEVPGAAPGDPPRSRVDFTKDFGYIGVSGYTLTNPATAYVKVEQLRPLKLTLAITRGSDGKWSTYVTSSEKNVGVDVSMSAVDTSILQKSWYERLGVGLQLGAGGSGAASGLSVLYSGDRFEFGPSAFVVAAEKVSKFYGATMVWRPFSRTR